MPVARIAATSTSCCSSDVRADSAQLVIVKNSAREWTSVVVQCLWPSLALLFTYRAEVRVGGYRNIENFKKAIFFYCGGLDLDPR